MADEELPDPEEAISLQIDPAEAGERLDRVLAARDLGYSRSALQRFIAEGRVRQAGDLADRKTRAVAGAEVLVLPAPPPPSTAEPQDIPLTILFEDDHLLVLDKPAGLVVHPGPGHADGTLVNALLFHAQLSPGSDPLRPGIVHRLDKDTSGVMVVAKTEDCHAALVRLFQAHDLERTYRAITVGRPPPQTTYDTFHARHPVHRTRFTSRTDRGRRAITHIELLENLYGGALVACRLHTGRTHQIRVHLADAGTPVLGDPLYGRSIADPELRRIGQTLGRQALHAAVLGFDHPITGEPLRFETQPPEDMATALDALRALTTS